MNLIKLKEPVILPNILRKGYEGTTMIVKRYLKSGWEEIAKGQINENGELSVSELREDMTIEDLIQQVQPQKKEQN